MKKLQIALSIILLFLFSINATLALDYSGISGKPAFPRDDNDQTKSIFIYTSEPGEIIEDGITVTNKTDDIKTLLVYQTDTANSNDGAFACKQFLDTNSKTGTWITMQKSEITLKPNSEKIIPFLISVPENIDVGEHNGCIAIQEKPMISRNKSGGVNLSTRIAIRVTITIPGDIIKSLEIEKFSSTSIENGNEIISVKTKNNGNVSLDTTVRVQVYDIFNKPIKKFEGDFITIREKNGEWNFEFPEVFWGGWYSATLQINYDEDPASELGIKNEEMIKTLTFPKIKFFMFPSTFGLIIEILILLFIFSAVTLSILGIKRYYWIKNKWVLYKIQPGDEIKDLAKKFDVSWSLLADANDLNPPYSLHELKTVLVPPQSPVPQKQPKTTKVAKAPSSLKKTSSTSISQEPLSKNDDEKYEN